VPLVHRQALDQWVNEKKIELRLIQTGKSTQNAYVKSFNGQFRDECLSEHWFRTLHEARDIVAASEWITTTPGTKRLGISNPSRIFLPLGEAKTPRSPCKEPWS